MAAVLPKFMTFRFARVGAYDGPGRLPTGWTPEGLSEVVVDHIDLSPEGPAITLSFTFGESGESEYVGLSLGSYELIDKDEPFVLKGEVNLSDCTAVTSVYWVIREWVSDGPFVDQATREVSIGKDPASAVVARTATDVGHVVQPVIVFKRTLNVAGGATVTLRRLVFSSLYRTPAWLGGEVR